MARQPRNVTALQMLAALLVLLVPLVAVVYFFTRNPEPPITPVDYRPLAEQAAAAASYPVLVPENLPDGWVATRARWTPAGGRLVGGEPAPGDTWQLGFLSPERSYFALDQRDVAPETFVADVTRQGRPDGETAVGQELWTRYLSEDGRTRSLVRESEGVTIVSGDLPYEALAAFASTLAPVE
ncbi:MAG: DUF4245 domain-containing protein [Actinomycetes bacterium]